MKDCTTRRSLFRAVVFTTLLLGLAVGSAPAQGTTSDSVVKATAKASKPDDKGNQNVTITLDITDNRYHLYANPVGNDSLKSTQTTVRFTSKLEGNAKVEYPEGKLIKDDVVGDYKIYEGTVTIKAKVRRTKGDTSPLALTIKLQACTKSTCLLPATVKLTAE
ncbi:MAG: hypothetical protein HYS12_01290 [Planctomycetes bacterium]|nr:hypothetical protein [Planctomycetota bacterium]